MSPDPSSLFGGNLSPEARETLGQPTSFGGAAPNFSRTANAPGTSGQESATRTVERLITDYEKVEANVATVRGRSLKEGLSIIKQRVQAGVLKRDITNLARKVDTQADKVTTWDQIRFNIPKEVEDAPEAYKAAFEERKKMFEENTGVLGATSRTIERRTKESGEMERTLGQRAWDAIKRREDFSVGQRMGRGVGMAGVAALSGSAAGVFGAAGGLAGGAVRAVSMGLAAATREAATLGGSILGGVLGALGGAIVGLLTAGPAGVIAGAAKGIGIGSAIGGEVGAGIGEIGATAIQAAGGAIAEMTTAVATMTGAAIDAAVPVYYQFEKQHTRMSALLRGGMQRTLGQNLMFGYSHGQTMQIMEQYARVTGTTEGSQHAMRYSRMYGVDPEKAIEVATIARRAGVLQGYRGILQRISGATHRAGMGTGRIGEQITSLSALSDLSMRARDELGETGLNQLIGLQGFFAQQGEAYRGQYGVRFLGNLQGAMTQNQDPYARQLMWRTAGRGGGSLGERIERYEAGIFDPGAISRLVAQVKQEYGDDQSRQILAMRQAVPGMRIESIQTLLGTEDLEGESKRIAAEESERAMKIGAGAFFTQQIEGINIQIGSSSHELLETFQKISEDAMTVIKLALSGGSPEEMKGAVGRLKGSIDVLGEPVEQLALGLASRVRGISISDMRKISGEEAVSLAQRGGLLAGGGISAQTLIGSALAFRDEKEMERFVRQFEQMLGKTLTVEQERSLMAGQYNIIMALKEEG